MPTSFVASAKGTYKLSSLDAQLVIDLENQLVKYRVESLGRRAVLFASPGKASVYQHWFFYWDDLQQELWFHSSDIGLFIWLKNESGSYEKKTVTEKSMLANRMPTEVTKALPQSLKKLLGK